MKSLIKAVAYGPSAPLLDAETSPQTASHPVFHLKPFSSWQGIALAAPGLAKKRSGPPHERSH
jgi:hypothetical protein